MDKKIQIALINQSLRRIPVAVINLYSDRIKYLDLTLNNIIHLKWLELFPNLETVIIDNNNLHDNIFIKYDLRKRIILKNIKTLSLNNNKLENLVILLKILSRIFPNLEHLSLLGNPACPDGLSKYKTNSTSYEAYRQYVASILPRLKFLDHMKIYRPFTGTIPERKTEILKFSPRIILAKLLGAQQREYTPLPSNIRQPGDHSGSYGVCLYKYIGTHSEGNRFIFNNDL